MTTRTTTRTTTTTTRTRTRTRRRTRSNNNNDDNDDDDNDADENEDAARSMSCPQVQMKSPSLFPSPDPYRHRRCAKLYNICFSYIFIFRLSIVFFSASREGEAKKHAHHSSRFTHPPDLYHFRIATLQGDGFQSELVNSTGFMVNISN